MFKRITVVISLVVMLFATALPQANAALSTGACVITLNFNFNGTVGLLSSPSFSYSGGGTCAATLGGDVVQSTSINGSGASVLWNCGAAVATGSWDQTFSSNIPNAFGSFVLSPVNGAYVLAVTAPGLVGTAQMTTIDAVPLATCATNPVESLTLVGVMEFQDP